ncbi:MAG: rod shape-determining protein MreC [Bdellovibrionaceae bacterium]|nr:rod shape-determining protein MreC [Pseudobdellovibrionaceae bacterium]
MPLITINMEEKQNDSEWFKQPFSWLAGHFQDFFYTYSQGVKNTTGQYLNLIQIKKQNENLKNQNQELTTRLLKFEEVNQENSRLKQLLAFRESTKMDLLAAQVIARDLIPDHSTITINKGTVDGLKEGQAVMTLQGALGYVFKPQQKTSHILLMTDRYAVIDGIIQRSRAHGIVEGKGKTGAVLKYVERTEDVRPGDLVVTGGLDNIFPKGFPVAIVESAEKKQISVSLKVDLKPLVDSDKVEEVFVILNAKNEDISEVFSTETKN